MTERPGEAGTDTQEPARDELAGLIDEIQLLRNEMQLLREEYQQLRAVKSDPGVQIADESPALDSPPPEKPAPEVQPWQRWQPAVATARAGLERARAQWAPLRAKWAPPQRTRGLDWSPAHLRWDVLALVLVVALAAAYRLIDLTGTPLGLQGQEASAGLEARRIREDGWIGVYSPVAGGHPTGVYYLTALSTAILGETILAIRIVPALLGILTVAALHLLLRRNFGFVTAGAASAFLALSLWHVIFSRTLHVASAWPLVMVLATFALVEALRTWSWRWWAAAGALSSLGLYTFNGHLYALALVATFVGVRLFGLTGLIAAMGFLAAIGAPGLLTFVLLLLTTALFAMSTEIRSRARWVATAAFGGAALVVAYPMLKHNAGDPSAGFRGRPGAWLIGSEEWPEGAPAGEQLRLLLGRYFDFWERLSFNPIPSVIDITGVAPLVSPVALALCLIGLVVAVARRSGSLVWIGALVVLVMPLAAALFTDLALIRGLVIVPFLAMFAGIAVAELVGAVRRRGSDARIAAAVVVALVAVVIAWRSLAGFGATMGSPTERWSLGYEMVAASQYVDDLPDDAYVYFFANRWPFDFEVMRFLAPDARGESRGEPFGPSSIEIDPALGEAVFVLVGSHRERLPEIQARHPGGTVIEGPLSPDAQLGPSYIAYVLPQAAEASAARLSGERGW